MYHACKRAIEFYYLDMYVVPTRLVRSHLLESRFSDPFPLWSRGACLQPILHCTIWLFFHATDPVASSRTLALLVSLPFPIHLIVCLMSCYGL